MAVDHQVRIVVVVRERPALGIGAAAGLKLIDNGARVNQRSEVKDQSSERNDQQRGSSPTVRESAFDREAEKSDDDSIQSLLLRQLRPSPRVGWGIVLGDERLATAMIDISDGLSSDLNHLCRESNAGALIESSSIPLDDDVKKLCGRRALDPLALALHGGEDFELLFSVPPENVSRLPRRVDGVPISHIGAITGPSEVRIRERNRIWTLTPQGFEHFRN